MERYLHKHLFLEKHGCFGVCTLGFINLLGRHHRLCLLFAGDNKKIGDIIEKLDCTQICNIFGEPETKLGLI